MQRDFNSRDNRPYIPPHFPKRSRPAPSRPAEPKPYQDVRAGWAVSRNFLFSEFASANCTLRPLRRKLITLSRRIRLNNVVDLILLQFPEVSLANRSPNTSQLSLRHRCSMFNKSGFSSANINLLWSLSHDLHRAPNDCKKNRVMVLLSLVQLTKSVVERSDYNHLFSDKLNLIFQFLLRFFQLNLQRHFYNALWKLRDYIIVCRTPPEVLRPCRMINKSDNCWLLPMWKT
ncbi:hypothetical protein PROFUN_15073 [Planoprotostelium fungivorum]|uniref:Uncharacterized protein n=1 Tax=Planoprotostelium fungivorum TaxID=1890364 RepID=A0A2P6MTC6_9EUKA|nr:hypothetical protein PROFUN_15073 [Planoprotostelium fungivorum]